MENLRTLNLTHNTDKLKEFINKYPDLPIVILADETSVMDNGAWTYCSKIDIRLDEILDCEYYDYGDMIITDRGRLEEVIEDNLYEEYHTKSEEEYDKAIKDKMKELEPYWKKVIAIFASN